MATTKTVVEVEVISKKTGYQWSSKDNPLETVIEIAVPYGDSVFHKLSGGTNMELRTINQEAADMFEIGKSYVMEIYPKPEEVKEKLTEDIKGVE